MKMIKFLSAVSLAIAAVTAPSAVWAEDPDWDGDIADIRVMDMAGKKFGERNKTSAELCTADNPVVAGEEVCIRVRMVVRNATYVKASMGAISPQTWTIEAGSEPSSVMDVPALGLRVGERNVWAEYSYTGAEWWQYSGMLQYDDSGTSSSDYTYFTDFYFKYTAQPGDMGMPVKLLLSNLEPAGSSRETNAYAFRGVNCLGSKFRIAARESAESAYFDAKLYRFNPTSFTLDYPGDAETYHYPLSDYNLEKEGLYIKSIDFDKVNAEGGTWSSGQVWREVYAGMSESVLTAPALAIQGGGKATEDIVVYVWSGNEEIMSPTGDDMRTITDENGKIRHVLAVHIAQGATGATFAMTGGVAKVGYSTEIYMSPTLGPVYDMAGTPSSAYVTRSVKIVAAPEPTVKMVFENGETTHDAVVADADYTTAKCQLVFKVVPAASQDVTVKLTATVDGGSSLSALYNNNIIRIPEGSGFDIDGKITTVTIPAGQTVTRSVYVLGASDSNPNTEGGINFKIEKYGALFPSGVSVETTGHTIIINRLGDEGITFAAKNPDPASGAVSMSMGTSKAFKFKLNDSYANGKSALGYTFYLVNHEDQTEYAKQEGVVYKSGWLTFNAKVNLTPGTYSADLYAVGPDGSTTAPIPYTLAVADAKKVVIAPSNGSYVVGEGEEPTFKLSLNTAHTSVTPKYIFLRTPKDGDDAFISTVLTNNGAMVDKDYKEVSVPQGVLFLDGSKSGRSITLNAFLGNNQSDPTDVDGSYNEGTVTVSVTNKPPVLNALTVAGISATALNDNGRALSDEVPMGVKKTFKITSVTEVDADLYSDEFQTKWVIDGEEKPIQNGNPIGQTQSHTFTSETASGKQGQLVQVYLMDKDMGGVWPALPNFTCYVKVRAKPYVSLETSAAGNLFIETSDTGVGSINVRLSEKASAPVDVQLTVSKPASGRFVLRAVDGSVIQESDYVYTLKFAAGATTKTVTIKELDGTAPTLGGIDLNAKVITETTNPEGVKWSDFYSPADPLMVRVQNMPPTVVRPTAAEQANTNMNASANTPYKVYYAAKDVDADLEAGIDIEISVDGTVSYTGKLTTTDIQFYEVEFDGVGAHEVHITYTDKDGETSDATVYYYVQLSKRLELRAHGPASASGSTGGYSAKYDAAKGLGAGRVFAGENGPQKVVSFVHTYSFNMSETAVSAYAYGYKADPNAIDDGTLYGKDKGIDKNGNWNKSLTISDYYNYCKDDYTPNGRHPGAEGLDSFLYGWACNNTSSGSDSGSSDSETVSFLMNIGESGEMAIPLPDPEEEGDEGEVKAAPVQHWEAVFSREYLKSDNFGDINLDGVPDKYVMLYRFDVLDSSYTLSSEGDDLRNLNFASDDSSTPYCAEGDYLPSTERTVYSTLIPNLPSEWITEGEAFTPVLKIRGFNDSDLVSANASVPSALNDAPHQIGLGYVSDQKYFNPKTNSDSTLSYVEWLAWCEWAMAKYPTEAAAAFADGGDYAAFESAHHREWSPENPTDPTKADTDGDGMTDGYEYYMWYMAHVGWVENFGKKNETHKRLTGRRYTPSNPGEGVRISPDEIAQYFNPNAASGSKTRDTDNDGLPDILEFLIGTNPVDFDTDGDGLPDGWEICIAGLDPVTANSSASLGSDRLRNDDGDAMAISSYQIELGQQPVSLSCEFAKRITFAVIDANGDSDGLQWYAMEAAPELKEGEAIAKWYKVIVDGTTYCALEKPVVIDGRLAGDTQVYTLAEYTLPAEEEGGEDPDGGLLTAEEGEEEPEGEVVTVRGFPVTLTAGTALDKDAEESTDEIKVFTIGAAIKSTDANACWIYGKGSADATVGEVAKTAAEYGCLALARPLAVKEGAELCAYPSDERDVAFLHFLCYQEFGFDPRTAWNPNSPLAGRWGKRVNGEVQAGVTQGGQGMYTSVATRTRAFTAYDEFLVSSFFYNNEGTWPTTVVPTNAKEAGALLQFWAALTTNPQGPVEEEETTASTDTETTTEEDAGYYGRNSDQGADTDGDGVPDGWELYVMAGPTDAETGAYVFAPPYGAFKAGVKGVSTMPKSYFSPFVDSAQSSDTCNILYIGFGDTYPLTEYRKFAGTDSCNYYSVVQDGKTSAYSTTIVRPSEDANWLNKFFPCDPWTSDTDGDGLADGAEGKHFVYGSPADDSTITSIPGGGLNPLSVDTDRDGLPDGWETQFKGTAASLYAGDGATYAQVDGSNVGNALQGLTDGMDGTVFDAFNYPSGKNGAYTTITRWGYSVNQVVNRDYDHDGLDNWQEYLTGTMRCWRYDDPVSPIYGIPESTYYKEDEEGNLVFNAEQAAEDLGFEDVNEFWYKTLEDASSEYYNPHLVTDTSSGAQYFSRLENVWDYAYMDKASQGGSRTGAYYWFYDRANGQSIALAWNARWAAALGVDTYDAFPVSYASCSPIDPDSDHDGMDDYYEVFHGMNPLLGTSGVKGTWWSVGGSGQKNDGEGFDIVYDSLSSLSGNIPQAWGTGDAADSYKNFWQRLWEKRASAGGEEGEEEKWEGALPRGTGFDFVFYPWLTGLATADADGDGTRNQEEAVMPLISPTTAWHHTDPTALWITDSSYSNSLVRTSYRMPLRTKVVELESSGFTYNETEYSFSSYDGYDEDAGGFLPFNPDVWSVATSQDKMNWIASFEENEGFDSDHDGLNDQDELAGKYRSQSDPLDADSPRRRQAMYFQGAAKPSILQTMPFVREQHPDASTFNQYPDDMSFLQFTIECWVNPDTLADATILERAVWTDVSNPADKEFLRCNFRIGIRGGMWYAKFDPNDTTKKEVAAASNIPAVAGGWTHLAVSYDGTVLTLYVNGVEHGHTQSGLQPAYGSASVSVNGMAGVHAQPGMNYWRDREYKLHAIVLGASFKNCAQGAKDGTALDVTRAAGWNAYTSFYKGYIDEIRIWDGARSVSDIQGDMNTRYTAAMASANREAFYEEWSQSPVAGDYCGRYAKDGSGNAYPLPAELRFHWSFDSAFGASTEEAVAKVPSGFNYRGSDSATDRGRAELTRPDDYQITWWNKILGGYTGTVYSDPCWIVWIPNTVTHLPRFDGTTLDSVYWSEDFAGDENGTYKFARTAEPVSFWTQYRCNGIEEGTIAYSSMGSRHFFVEAYDATNKTEFAKNYTFTGRHLNQSGDDMLALGGAFVKHIDDLWDNQGSSSNWEVSGNDNDADGLPDWWELLAHDEYADDPADEIEWETIVTWPDENGTRMTAGEAYLRDLARGYHTNNGAEYAEDGQDDLFRQRYDLDANGLPDWWEELYGIAGEDMFADHDNDGLSNYTEYLLSEVFTFDNIRFSPVDARSVDPFVPDYFYRVGSLYVGEIFTDHDQVDDAWEGLYEQWFGSRLLFDAYADADADGWSNRSEVRYSKQSFPTIADQQTHYTAADGLVADYPIPTLSLTLHYNGVSQATVAKSAIIVQVTSGQLSETEPDAEFVVGEVSDTAAGTGTSDTDEEEDANAYTRTLGKWSNRHVVGTLTPGYINKASVALECCYDPSSEVYNWTVENTLREYRGTRAEYDAARRKYGQQNVHLLSKDTSYAALTDLELRTTEDGSTATWVNTHNGKTFGTLNLTTGAFDLDFGVFEGQYIVNSTNMEDRASLEDQSFRIVYSVNPAVDLPRKLYLGSADTGHVREGKNTVVAFADLDGSGTFTPGEPYGMVKNVDISWKGTSVAMELTKISPVMPRITLWSSSDSESSESSDSAGTADRLSTKETIYQKIKDDIYAQNLTERARTEALAALGWMDTNPIEAPELTGNEDEIRVRIVRWLIDGTPVWKAGVKPTVIFDKKLSQSADSVLTEANILSDEVFDLDWKNFQEEVVNAEGIEKWEKPLTEIDYLVVVGEGVTAFMGANDSNNVVRALSQVLVRKYGTSHVKPTIVSPSAKSGQTVRAANPTFVWKMDEEDVAGYTAFRIQVTALAGGALVYDSGLRVAPPRNSDGSYSWTAPLYAGDKTAADRVYANNALYSWKVSMYNAKYQEDAYSTTGLYLHCVQTNGLEHGTANVAVKYFGPSESYKGKTIRVRAYASPDFTGDPVAAGYVASPDDAQTGVAVAGREVAANCRLIGIPAGSYYIQAFIDSNTNGVCDAWETMGYLCSRDGSTADWLNPVAMTFDGTVGSGDLAVIYLEDADTDDDALPDAWEYAMYGSLTAKGVETAAVTDVGGLVTNAVLKCNLKALPNSDVNAGLSGRILLSMASSPEVVSLATGLDTTRLTVSAAGTYVAEPAVKTLTISDYAFDAETSTVSLSVSAAFEATAIDSPFYSVTVLSGVPVTVKVLYTETLAGEWKEVGTPTQITITETTGEKISVPMEGIEKNGGFFKVVVEQ